MKMRLVKVGADGANGTQLVLMGTVEEIRAIRHMVGLEVEVSIAPVLRFNRGDRVLYSPVIGREDDGEVREVRDGPFIVGGQLCWKVSGKSAVVCDAALAPAPGQIALLPADTVAAAHRMDAKGGGR